MEEEGEEEEVKKKKVVKKVKKVVKKKVKPADSEEGASTPDDAENPSKKAEVTKPDEKSPAVMIGHSESKLKADDKKETKEDTKDKTDRRKGKGAEDIKLETEKVTGGEEAADKDEIIRTEEEITSELKVSEAKTDENEDEKNIGETEEKSETFKDGVEEALLKLGKNVSFSPITQFFKGKKRTDKTDTDEAAAAKKSNLGSDKKHVTAALTTVFLDSPGGKSNEKKSDPDVKLPGSSECIEVKGEDSQPLPTNTTDVSPEQTPKDNVSSAGMKLLGAMRKIVDVPMHAIKIKSKDVHPDVSEKAVVDQSDNAASSERKDQKHSEDQEGLSSELPSKEESGTTGKKILGAMKRIVEVPMHAIKIKSHEEAQRGAVENIVEGPTEGNVQSTEVHDEEKPAAEHHPKGESGTTGKKILGAMKKMVDVPMHAIKIKHKELAHPETAEKMEVDETSGNADFSDSQKEGLPLSPQKDVEGALENHPKDEHDSTGKRFLGAMKRIVDVPMHAIKIKSKDAQSEATVKSEVDQTAGTIESTQVKDEELSSAPQSNVEDTSKHLKKEEPSSTGKKILGAMKKIVEVPMHAIKIKSSEETQKEATAETEEQKTSNVECPKVQDEELSPAPQSDVDDTSKHLIKDEPSSTGKKILGAMKKMVEVPMHAIKIKSTEEPQKAVIVETTDLTNDNVESPKIQDEDVSPSQKNVEEHPTKDTTGTTGKKILGAMKKMVEVPMHAIKIKSKEEVPADRADELRVDQKGDDVDSPETHEEKLRSDSQKIVDETVPEKPLHDEPSVKGRNIFGTMKKMVEAPMQAIRTKRKDDVVETTEKLEVDQTDTTESSKVLSDEGSPIQTKDTDYAPSDHPVKEDRVVTGKKIIGAMKKMVEVPMHAIRIKGKEEAQTETPENVDEGADTKVALSETEGENVYPLPPKSAEIAAPDLPPKDDSSASGKKILGAMKKMVDVPMTAIRVKMDSISPTRKEKKEKTDKEIKEEEILEIKAKDETGSPPLPPRNKTGPGAAKLSNKFRFWEKKKEKVESQSPRTRAEKEIFELFSKNFFSDDPNRFLTLQPRKNIGPDGRIRESSLPPANKLKGSEGGKLPKVPPKTWMWEELRRTKLKGGYPWTHLYKGSIDEARWKEIMEHEYEYVDPRPELLRPETVAGGRLTPKGSPRVSPRATPEPERPKPQRRFIRIPDSDHVIIPLHGSSDEEHNPDRYEHPELVGQEEIGATPAKFQPTPSPSPSRRKAAAEPKLSEKLRTTAGHLGSKIRKTIPDRSKLRLPDKPKFLADIPQIKLPETPKFLTEKPKFLTEKPKFLTEKPKFLTEKPKFLTEKPKFLTEKPKFLTEKPKFLTEKPKFLTEKPKFLTEKPKFLTERPKFLTERPKFLTERPKFLKEGIKFPDRSKLTMPSIKFPKTRRSRTNRDASVKSEFGSEKNIFHSLKARTYPRFLNKRKKQGTKKTTPPPGQSKFDSESLPSTPRSKRNDKWTEVYKQKSVDEVKVASYTNGESFHERYSKREAKRASSSSVADSDREQGMAQDEVKVEYDVPVAPVRKSRSRGTSVADEDRTSRGAESLKSEMQIDDDLNDEFQMEDDQKVKEVKEPMQMDTSIRMVEMTIVQSAVQEPAYSNVSKLRPPRPPPPQKEAETGTLPRLKSKIMGHKHMQQLQTWKNQGVDLFFTYPRKAMKSIRKGPKRPVRNYCTIAGPIRPPRRRKGFREPVYVDADIEPADSIPYIDEVTGGMKGRPLPPPPRPPLPRTDYLEGEVEPMVTDEPNALKVLVGQDFADEALPAIPSQERVSRQDDALDRMQGRPLPPPPRRKRSSSAASRKRETTPPLEAEVLDNYEGEEEEAIDARMTIDISEPITVLSVEQIEPAKSESDLVKSETALPTKIINEPDYATKKITAEISQQTSLDIGEMNVSVQTDPLPDGAILDDSEEAILKLKPLDSDEEPTIEKYLEKYENEFKLLGRQMTPSKTLEPVSITPPQTTSAEEEYEEEVEVIEPDISDILEKRISEYMEQEIPETFEEEIPEREDKETPISINKEIIQTEEAEALESSEVEETAEVQEKGIIESSEKQVTESLEKEIILTDEEAERNINKAETKIIEKAMPIQDEEPPQEEPTKEEPTKEEPSKDKSDEKLEPPKAYDIPFSFPDRLHLTHLDVDNLNVSSLKASHILVSDLTGQSMQVAELTSRGGNLVVNGMELPPSFVQTLADEITAKVEDKLPQRQAEPIQPVVDIVQKLLDIQLQQPQPSTTQQQPQIPVIVPSAPQPQVTSQQKPLDEISPQESKLEKHVQESPAETTAQESEAKKPLEESQTEKLAEAEPTSVPIRSESPHQPQKLTVVTAPPTVVVQTAAESVSQLTPEAGTLSASDSIPTPRTTRNKGKKTIEFTRIVDDSEDELATTMPPKPTISRIIPIKPSTSKAIPSTSKAVPSTSEAVQPTSASGLTARQLLKELLKIWKACMTEGFVACSNTVGSMFPEGQKRRDAQTAACVLFVIIIALFALGFGTDNTVHYHHWDFVPPR